MHSLKLKTQGTWYDIVTGKDSFNPTIGCNEVNQTVYDNYTYAFSAQKIK
jgi:hypothetical protein